MRNKLIAGVTAGFVVAIAAAIPAQAISPTTANLYVLHAVPAATVDVYVNDKLTLDNFKPGTLTDPLDLPAGTYKVSVSPENSTDSATPAPIIGPANITLAANTSYTAVAHLDASDKPTLTLFTNDLSKIPAGQGKLTVRHTAGAPAVDVLANGKAAFTNLVNPKEVKADLPVGTISAAVALTGTTAPVIGPADVKIQEGVNTIVYAWGSAAGGNLALAVQTIGGLHSNPGGVNSGQAGLVADPDPAVTAWSLAGLLALVAAGTISLLGVRSARRSQR